MHASQMQSKPIKLGSFGNDPRFKRGKIKSTPGVGDYDLTGFKNFAKASETVFEIPKYSKVQSNRLNQHNRARSAVNRTIDQSNYANRTAISGSDNKPLRSARSRSPASLMGIQIGKRLGGPSSANQNYFMQASREQRRKIFTKESASANLNSLGPGPTKYIKENADRQRFGEKDRFTIP